MAASNKRASQRSSLSTKFNQSLLTVFLILALILVPAIYYLTKTQVLAQANSELTLLVDMIKSVRNVVREETRPHFAPRNEYFPVVVSSTVMAKAVAEKFAKVRPEYYIKIFADNPLNADDLPDELESELLSRFRQNPNLKSIIETGQVRGQKYLVSSAPATAKKGCLLCHGIPNSAPKEISAKYGITSGYGWEIGDIVGGIAVGVPLADVTLITLKRSMYSLLALALIFGALYLYINYIVRKSIIAPVLKIADTAEKVAKGDLANKVEFDGDNELGELANSFELMRRSIISLVRRIKSK